MEEPPGDVRSITERDGELRELIRSRVTSEAMQKKIKECVEELQVQEKRRRKDGKEGEESNNLLRLLEERGLVEDVMAGLKLGGDLGGRNNGPTSKGETSAQKTDEAKSGKHVRCIYFQVLEGRAFVDHLTSEIELLPQDTPTFTLHMYFRHQRFQSSAVPCSCEPEFKEGFLLELPRGSKDNWITSPELIHLVLTRTRPNRGGMTKELVGSYLLDWRSVLASPNNKINKSFELIGPRADGRVSPGVLTLQWELFPHERNSHNKLVIDKKILEAQVSLERQKEMERKRLFLLYAKQWWAEFIAIRGPAYEQRLVKVFAEDERGDTHFVCHYVSPVRVREGLLESPRHAARFVSLFQYQETAGVGGDDGAGLDGTWQSITSFLSTKSGSCEDHCVLLCSLLLGYGLDAYVCIGTKTKHQLPHSWVMTINENGSVIFWESLTAQRKSELIQIKKCMPMYCRYHQSVYDPDTQAGTVLTPPSHPYRTIGCVFNHKTFYANAQSSDSVLTCNFNINNKSHWKRLSNEDVAIVRQLYIPPLVESRVDHQSTSVRLEESLKSLVAQHRVDCGLTTQYDPDLSYLLGPALSSYELERRDGVSVGVEEFQEAIRRYVLEGHTFKGFPIQFNHFNAHNIFVTCLKSPVGGDIIGCRGDSVRLAVCVKVYPYPEDVQAVWIMLAVTYQSIL